MTRSALKAFAIVIVIVGLPIVVFLSYSRVCVESTSDMVQMEYLALHGGLSTAYDLCLKPIHRNKPFLSFDCFVNNKETMVVVMAYWTWLDIPFSTKEWPID